MSPVGVGRDGAQLVSESSRLLSARPTRLLAALRRAATAAAARGGHVGRSIGASSLAKQSCSDGVGRPWGCSVYQRGRWEGRVVVVGVEVAVVVVVVVVVEVVAAGGRDEKRIKSEGGRRVEGARLANRTRMVEAAILCRQEKADDLDGERSKWSRRGSTGVVVEADS